MSVAYSIIPGNITRLLLFFFKYIYFPGHWRRGNDASHERFGQFAGGGVRCRNAISDVFIRNVHDSDETKS